MRSIFVFLLISIQIFSCGSKANSTAETTSSDNSVDDDKQLVTLDISGDVNESFSTGIAIGQGGASHDGKNFMMFSIRLDNSYSSNSPTLTIGLVKFEEGKIELAYGQDGEVKDGQVSASIGDYGYILNEPATLTITGFSDDWVEGNGTDITLEGTHVQDYSAESPRKRTITISNLKFKLKNPIKK